MTPRTLQEGAELARETILIVDDDAVVRSIVKRTLVNAGYRIAEAGCGEEALTCIQRQPIHLVVMDMTMPGMDRRQLSEQLRKTFPDLPIIFMSGYTHPGRTPLGPWLAKPFTGEQLVNTVRAVCQTRSSRPVYAPEGDRSLA